MRGKLFYLLILIFVWSFANGQNSPVAVNDDFILILENWTPDLDTNISFNLVMNDYDPDNDNFRIKEIFRVGGQQNPIEFTDSMVILNFDGIGALDQRIYKYRICQINDTTIISNWAFVDINGVMSQDAPIAINDTFVVIPGYDFHLNVLENDYCLSGNSIFLESTIASSDSTINYHVDWGDYHDLYRGYRRIFYTISDTLPWYAGQFDRGWVYVNIENIEFYDSLNINNINAMFNCFGNHFWDMPGGPRGPRFYAPNGGLTSSVFSNSLWIGGLDINNNLHLAAERYRQDGNDYWPGPISDTYDSVYDLNWHYVWKLSKEDIDYHKQNCWNPGYECHNDILTWPGNGDVNNGQAEILAPFHDANNNGIYEPLSGDWPVIKGDQALFFIFNDEREIHTESEGGKMGIEIHGTAYAFDTPEDSALWNTIFLHYDIINRSDTTYNSCYIGNFTDFDLGNPWDDYIGCDVQRGIFYAYNGDDYDDDYLNNNDQIIPGYHENPPVMGIQFIGGPTMDSDDIDNPSGGCDVSINGLNFGDTIVDNERLGMTRFSYFSNQGPAATTDPSVAPEYYNYLKGIWKDNTHILYGGNGHINSGAVGPECNFMFPNNSDSCNWGTGGTIPNGGYNQNGLYWTEEVVGNTPSDRRGLGVSGPFTFEPGQIHQLDLAFVFARDYDGIGLSSLEVMQENCQYIYELFEFDPEFFSAINPQVYDGQIINVYPNPFNGWIIIEGLPKNMEAKYLLYDILGNNVGHSESVLSNGQRINLGELMQGLYILKIQYDQKIETFKIFKR